MKSLKVVCACTIGAAILGAAYEAQGVVVGVPFGSITVQTGDKTDTIPLSLIATETGWGFEVGVGASEYSIQGAGNFDTDPSLAYAIGVVDFGAPSVFGFFFGTPIVPTGPATTVNASIVGGLTDFTGDGVSLTPVGPLAQTSSVGFPLTPMGVDVGAAFAAGPGPAGALHTYGSYAAGPIPGPVGIWTFLSVSTSFGLSGNGDAAALTGFAQVETAVPDSGPGLAGVMTLGLLLVAGSASRRIKAFGQAK